MPSPYNAEVIIIKYNQPELEEKCIYSVHQYTDGHKITIFNNTDKDSLTKIWNDLIKKSDAEFICLLNSDTVVTEHWLERMLRGFDDPKVAAISCSSSYASGQHIDEYEEYRDKRYEYTKEQIDELGRKVYQKYGDEFVEQHTLSGFCYVLRKSAWEAMGGFNEIFRFYGAESEFDVRLLKAGWKLLWAKGVYVHHYGMASFNKAVQDGEMDNEYERRIGGKLMKYLAENTFYSPEETIEVLNQKLSHDPIQRGAFVRFGDGEMSLINGWEGKASNHITSKKLIEELKNAVHSEGDDYMIAFIGNNNLPHMAKGTFQTEWKHREYVEIFEVVKNTNKIYNAVAFHYLSMFRPEMIVDFVNRRIRNRRTMLVSHHDNRRVAYILGCKHFIEVPKRQAYYSKSEFWLELIEKSKDVEIILFGCGVASKPFQKEIWDKGYPVFTLDAGSWLDAISGLKTRGWITNNLARAAHFKELLCKSNPSFQ